MTEPAGPLAAVRVVLVGSGTPIDTFGAVLAEQGADVVRVEPPGGDPGRQRPPLVDGASVAWAVAARGTRSVVADLDDARGVALARRLVERAAVVGDALGTGGLEARGLDPRTLVGPAVVVRFSGPGDPEAPELVALAAGGMLGITGQPDRPPVALGVRVAEQLAGIFGATAATAALAGGAPGPPPVVADVPTHAGVLRIAEWGIAAHDRTGFVREREGNRPSRVAPLDVYRAADGRHVAIVGGSDANFARLVAAMGRPDLGDDPRFGDPEARVAHAPAINGEVAAWVAGLDADEVEARCVAAGAPASVVRTAAELVDDGHLRARGDLVVVDDPVLGAHRQQAVHPRFVDRPVPGVRPAPQLGEHADAVWSGELGLTGAELRELRDAGIV